MSAMVFYQYEIRMTKLTLLLCHRSLSRTMPTLRWARKGRNLFPRKHICQEMNLNIPFYPIYISCGLLNHHHIADSQAPLHQLPPASSSTALFRDAHTTAIVTMPTTSRPTMSARASLLISRTMSLPAPEVEARNHDLTD